MIASTAWAAPAGARDRVNRPLYREACWRAGHPRPEGGVCVCRVVDESDADSAVWTFEPRVHAPRR